MENVEVMENVVETVVEKSTEVAKKSNAKLVAGIAGGVALVGGAVIFGITKYKKHKADKADREFYKDGGYDVHSTKVIEEFEKPVSEVVDEEESE